MLQDGVGQLDECPTRRAQQHEATRPVPGVVVQSSRTLRSW